MDMGREQTAVLPTSVHTGTAWSRLQEPTRQTGHTGMYAEAQYMYNQSVNQSIFYSFEYYLVT